MRRGVPVEFFTGGWSGLLPAVVAGQADLMWDTLYYTPERAKQIDYVIYMTAATGGLVAKGNPKKITSILTMCAGCVPPPGSARSRKRRSAT